MYRLLAINPAGRHPGKQLARAVVERWPVPVASDVAMSTKTPQDLQTIETLRLTSVG
jgi:hypothetical protein